MTNFAVRILAYKPARPRDNRWIERSEQKRKGKYRYAGGSDLPEGTYTKSASHIVQVLKTKSADFEQAMSRLNGYINMNGDNLEPADVNRLEQAKKGLYRAYGREVPNDYS